MYIVYCCPREFAKQIGKSQEWVFRQIAAGNINTVEHAGSTMINQDEIHRMHQSRILARKTSRVKELTDTPYELIA